MIGVGGHVLNADIAPYKVYELSLVEIETMYNLIKYQYVSYENEAGIQLIKKLREIIEGESTK